MFLPLSLLALLAAGPARAVRPPMTTAYRPHEEYALKGRRAAATTESSIIIDQGGYLTRFDADWGFSMSICASWLEPSSHSSTCHAIWRSGQYRAKVDTGIFQQSMSAAMRTRNAAWSLFHMMIASRQ